MFYEGRSRTREIYIYISCEPNDYWKLLLLLYCIVLLLFFRFAERIFWSIEAIRANNAKETNEALSHVTAPRTIELYIFLQSYLHAVPQVLLQLYILMRHNADINRETGLYIYIFCYLCYAPLFLNETMRVVCKIRSRNRRSRVKFPHFPPLWADA